MTNIEVWQDIRNGTYVLKGVYGDTEIHFSPERAQGLYRELANYFAPAEAPDKRQDYRVADERPQLSREQIDDMNSGD